jgi:hypothetical protein
MLPRTKVQIQNDFLAWIDQLAEDNGWTLNQKGEAKLALLPEIDWMIRVKDLEVMLSARLSKINTLLLANEGNLSSFDSFWSERKALLEWMQT